MTGLLPCPFCGNGDAPFTITEDRAWVECGDCVSRVTIGPFDTEAEAIASWNRRASPAADRLARIEAVMVGEKAVERVANSIVTVHFGECNVTDWKEREWNPAIAATWNSAAAALAALRELIARDE